jgi:pilus assembly protein Flp/PilA
MRFQNQKGQGLVEYLIIVALVAVGTIGIMRVVGQSLTVKFAQVAKSLGADVKGQIDTPQVTETLYRKKDMRNFLSGAVGTKDQKDNED